METDVAETVEVAPEPEPATPVMRTPRVPADPRLKAIADRAREVAPSIKSAITPSEVRSFEAVVGHSDPLELLGTDAATAAAWADEKIPKEDERAVALRASSRTISRHPAAIKNLWGRKIAALAVAVSEARRA